MKLSLQLQVYQQRRVLKKLLQYRYCTTHLFFTQQDVLRTTHNLRAVMGLKAFLTTLKTLGVLQLQRL